MALVFVFQSNKFSYEYHQLMCAIKIIGVGGWLGYFLLSSACLILGFGCLGAYFLRRP